MYHSNNTTLPDFNPKISTQLLSPTNISCPSFGLLLVNNELVHKTYLAVSVVASTLTVLTIVLNGLVLYVLLSLQKFKTPSNYSLAMLVVVNLSAGVTCLPLYSTYMRYLMLGKLDCILGKALMVTGYSLTLISAITISFITLQLYQAILHPFKHHRRQGKFGYLYTLVVSWTVTLLVVVLIVFAFPGYWEYFKLISGVLLLVVYCVLSISDFKIYSSTRRIKDAQKKKCNKLLRMNDKILRMITSVLIAFGVSYLPYIIFAVYITIHGLSPYVRSVYGPWVEVFALFTYAINPCIYCFRFKSIRHKIRNFVCFHRSSQENTNKRLSLLQSRSDLPVNSVNLSILTSSFTSLSSIRFNHETKYNQDVLSSHQELCKTLKQKAENNNNTLDDFHPHQAVVLKQAKFLFLP